MPCLQSYYSALSLSKLLSAPFFLRSVWMVIQFSQDSLHFTSESNLLTYIQR